MSEQSQKDFALIDEFVRQTGTQAALIAGFTFTILTAVSLDSSTPYRRGMAFIICAVLTIAFELFTAFILSSLAFVVKINFSEQAEDIFQTEVNLAWASYLLGLLSFVAALILLAWIKYSSAALWVMAIIFMILILSIVVFFNMVRKNNRLAS